MRFSPRKIVIILVFLAMASQLLMFTVSAVEASPSLDPASNSTPSKMEVGVYVNSVDNLDYIKGTYDMDFYLHFRWTDPNISTAHFEIMNGKTAIGSHSMDILYNKTSGPVKEEWYRVRAELKTDTDTTYFPFEKGTLQLEIEDASNRASQLIFAELEEERVNEIRFKIPGWKIGTPTSRVENYSYPEGSPYSRFSYNIPIENKGVDAIVQTLIPPLIFCFIAFLSFFIKVEHNELVHLRYVLTTTMFITAVMYHFTEMAVLPSFVVFNLFDKYMIAVYLFLASTIIVTTLCYLALWDWKRPGLVKPINRYGMVISILVPVVSFCLLVTFM